MKPKRCRYTSDFAECGGTSFRRSEDRDGIWWECETCGQWSLDHVPTATTRTLARCEECKESFLWNKTKHSGGPPSFCRACRELMGAERHEAAARKARARERAYRASQRRAVARFKPPESASQT